MGKPQSEAPARNFPHKISRRILLLSHPRRTFELSEEGYPAVTPRGIRKSALRASCPDRIIDAAFPYTRRVILTKRMYKHRFSQDRLNKMDKLIETANATIYSKLANCVLDLKKQEVKKKRGWTESEWKKHMDYINQISGPKKDFRPDAVDRGPWKPIEQLLPRINEISSLPQYKMYRRLSKEVWYRDPVKVSPNALKYVISDRVKKLSAPRVLPPAD